MVAVNPQTIEGKWRSGVALDFHTTSSTPIGYNEFGHMQFETTRPPIAELLYQFKYRHDQGAAHEIIAAAATYLGSRRHYFDILVPVPPSAIREVQPVLVLANGIGARLNLPVASCIRATRQTTELKRVTDPVQRKELLDGLYAVDSTQTKGKRVLLFDDLFRSGATLNAITEVLLQQGQAASVDVLTITRTRRNR